MCIAKTYTEQLLDIYNSINSEVRRLCAEVNKADLYDLDMLHIIENTNFNASEGYMLAKQLRDNRTNRRKLKNELETMKQLKNNFIDKNMEILNKTHQEIVNKNNILNGLVEHRVYTPRIIGKEESELVAETKEVELNIVKPVVSKTPICKKSKEEIQILNAIDSKHYLVKKKNGVKMVMSSKNILNLECLNLAGK